ncbi:MAG: alpha/beta fold hydrolase [Hyphomonas sp.]
MRSIWKITALIVILGVVWGGWQFFHPPMPPLREPYTEAQEPIDSRTGLYLADDSGEHSLVVPALTSGFYAMPVDRWGPHEKLSGEQLQERNLLRLESQPYDIREIQIEQDVPLAAWLFEPARDAKGGLLILHGAGDSSRANSWYVYLAHTLASAGYVVVLPDKRGSGRSGGDWRSEPLTRLAQDGAAWLQKLRVEVPGLAKYGLIGISQGGTIAPEAARLSDADFAFAESAVALPLKAQLPVEVGNDIASANAPKLLRPFLTWIYTARATNRYRQFWKHNSDYDMVTEWEKWGGPFFVAYGERDEFQFVPVEASVQRLAKSHPDDPNIRWRVYDRVSHSLTYQEGPAEGQFHAQHLADTLRWLETYQVPDLVPDGTEDGK